MYRLISIGDVLAAAFGIFVGICVTIVAQQIRRALAKA